MSGCPWAEWEAEAKSRIVGADKPRVGDVRLVGGVPALLFRESDDGFTACPVKQVPENDDDITGKVVFVELSGKQMWEDNSLFNSICMSGPTHGLALAEFGAHVYREHVGELLYRVFPEQVLKARRCYAKVFADNDEDWDIDRPNSDEDWRLYKDMSRESWRKFFAYEADTFVVREDGSARPLTKKERRLRIRRYERHQKAKRESGT